MLSVRRFYFFVALSVISSCFAKNSQVSVLASISSLRDSLSQNASISLQSTRPRWSDFRAPHPGVVVLVGTENDVVKTVRWCRSNSVAFLVQNGGGGWISDFNLGKNGLLIDLAGLNQVTFNEQRTEATIGGGALVKEAMVAAYGNNAQVLTGDCNCVGVLGPILGGGYGNLMGFFGHGVDALLSVNYVSPSGYLSTISSKDADLWWAIRGAGPNFGVITSALVRARPVEKSRNVGWLGSLIFEETKLEAVVSAINDLYLEAEMSILLYFYVNDSKPVINAVPFYYGNESIARQKFAAIIDIGPSLDQSSMVRYDEWNDGADGAFCVRGGCKPAYGAGLANVNPRVWASIFERFKTFTKLNSTERSIVLVKSYSTETSRTFASNSSSFPFRDIRFMSIIIPTYSDKSLDKIALEYGSTSRELLWANSDLPTNISYINFAHGKEPLEAVYGGNVERLQKIKKKYDPENIFNHWFPLTPRVT